MTGRMKSRARLDVAVAGGGVVGAACALALARAGLDVALVEARPVPRWLAEQPDLRVYALAPDNAAQRVQQGGGIVGHVGQPVGQLCPQPEQPHQRNPADIGHAAVAELFRQADVAVVVPDDMETTRHQRLDQFDRPQRQLRAQPHDQQQRRVRRIAVGFVFDPDSVGDDVRHGGSPDNFGEG